ncbi:MAG: APC family permease [Planctomycetes bacterium]|nr:APC family permease [Planctomycetota bacterium]
MKNRWISLLFGPEKDPFNPRVFHTVTLVAFLAWVGLGADGLSSSCYGPEEAFLSLGPYSHLAVPLALLMAITVFIISASYSQIIEKFPSGGGGYVVTTKLLGRGPGVVCGCALLLDYILTIAISVSSGIDAFFSSLPYEAGQWKVYATLAIVVFLMWLNLRGVKESVLVLLPIFVVFLLTHLAALLTVFIANGHETWSLITNTPARIGYDAEQAGGWLPLLAIFFGAFAIGGGTYTGIEAVSNSLQILREPRAATGKRTMLYMAISLAVTASGLLFAYLIVQVAHVPGKTLNAALFETVFEGWRPAGVPLGHWLVLLTLAAEGALLFVAAQAGFIGGPRTLANMALDRWVPARFMHLSSRLVIQDGVLFMGVAAILFVIVTRANVKLLVILYSINVFVTFTLSQLGMCVHWLRARPRALPWRRKLLLNGSGLILTATVLVMMIYFKFNKGAWVTLLITALAVCIVYLIRGHYEKVRKSLKELDRLLEAPPEPNPPPPPAKSPKGPTAVILVGGYNGLGVHSFLTVLRQFPSHFKNFVFVSVGVIDFDEFKGAEEIERLRERTNAALQKYISRASTMGVYAEYRAIVGTDLVDEAEKEARQLAREFPGAIFFLGQLVFEQGNFFTHFLHSQSAFEIQRRLQFSGLSTVLLPIRCSWQDSWTGSGKK